MFCLLFLVQYFIYLIAKLYLFFTSYLFKNNRNLINVLLRWVQRKKLSKADNEMETILGSEKGEWHSMVMIIKI